jgi:hypothetical protein
VASPEGTFHFLPSVLTDGQYDGQYGGALDSTTAHTKRPLGTSEKAQQASVNISIWYARKSGITIYQSTS